MAFSDRNEMRKEATHPPNTGGLIFLKPFLPDWNMITPNDKAAIIFSVFYLHVNNIFPTFVFIKTFASVYTQASVITQH